MVTRARLKTESGMDLYRMGALKVFTCGGPGLRQTSVGTWVVGDRVKEVAFRGGSGPEDSKRDQETWWDRDILR